MTLRVMARGGSDPQVRTLGRDTWYCTETPDGPVTCLLQQVSDVAVDATAWGPGAPWQLEHLPQLLGEASDVREVIAHHHVVDRAQRRLPGLRVPSTGRVMTALSTAILEQRVVGLDAMLARRRLFAGWGSEPPGPAPRGMRVPPLPDQWATIASWEWHRAGVDPARARTIVGVSRRAASLERVRTMDPPEAATALLSLNGVGSWTVAETAKVALGDTDAVSVGDYHLAGFVTWALTGVRGGDDARMLQELEPYRPHRQLVIRLLELTLRMPRRGHRAARVDHRRH